jgi:hypothetical protein
VTCGVRASVRGGSARRTGGGRPCRAMQGSHAGRSAAVRLLDENENAAQVRVPCRLEKPGGDTRGSLRARLLDEEIAQVDAGQAALRGRDGVEDGRVRRARVALLPAWARANVRPSSGLCFSVRTFRRGACRSK